MKVTLIASAEKPDVSIMVHTARYWLHPAEDRYVAVWVGKDSVEQSAVYSRRDLAAYHAVLPDVIKGMLRLDASRNGKLHAPGICVEASVKLLDALLTVTDVWGGIAHIMHIQSIKRSPSGVNVDFYCERIYSESTLVDGKELRLATNGSFGAVNVPVPVADLDTRYPGWGNRLALCADLDATNDTAMRFVFHDSPLSPDAAELPTFGMTQ